MAISGVGSSSVSNQYASAKAEEEKKIGKYLTDDAKKVLDAIDNDADNNKRIKDNKMASQDAFMKILMTQLQNQDPLAPMENTEMVSQMSQFSQLEAIQQMAKLNEQTTKSLEHLVEKSNNNEVMQLEIVNQLVKLNKGIEELIDKDKDDETDDSKDDTTEETTES